MPARLGFAVFSLDNDPRLHHRYDKTSESADMIRQATDSSASGAQVRKNFIRWGRGPSPPAGT